MSTHLHESEDSLEKMRESTLLDYSDTLTLGDAMDLMIDSDINMEKPDTEMYGYSQSLLEQSA